MSNKIDELIGTGVIEKTKGDYIKEKFQDFTQAIEEWSKKANAIVVTDENQKELMAEAREGRLLLKAKRIEVEKTRKSLKDQSLSEGRLIDSVAKYLTGLIEPAEKHLELQEKFIEIQEQNKRIQLKSDRTVLLEPYRDVIDPNSIQLDLITEEAFTTILNGAKFAQENKKTEALRIENEILEKEKKQKTYQERMLQIAEYKKYYNPDTDLVLTPETNTLDFNAFLQNLIYRYSQDVIKQKKLEEENNKLKKQNVSSEKKINKLQTILKTNPSNKPQEPTTIVKKEVVSTTEFIETQNEDLIMVNRKEYETLKIRYGIAKSTLDAVLYFIVPQNLRDLVNKALKDIADVDVK
jgi:hypothetical protein